MEKVYMVYFLDMTMGYGCYVHLVGIFDTEEEANEIKECVTVIFNEQNHDENVVELHVDEIKLNDPRFPFYSTDAECYIGGVLGGYRE